MGGAGVTVTATTVERRRVLGEINAGRRKRGAAGGETDQKGKGRVHKEAGRGSGREKGDKVTQILTRGA